MDEIDFDSLCAERDALRNYVLVHASSLGAFSEEGKPWFRRQEQADPPKPGRVVRHLTTTASCLESLYDVPLYESDDPPAPCPSDWQDVGERRQSFMKDFVETLLSADLTEWKTEDEDLIYTRVRTLPVLLSLAPVEILGPFDTRLTELLKQVWKTLRVRDATAQGIREEPTDGGEGYPPNAYHTYWAIRMLKEYQQRKLSAVPSSILQKEAVARLWSRRTLATQTALISSERRTIDAQQLAWALSTDVLCRGGRPDQPTTTDHQHAELYEAALAAFFSEQKDGQWRLYEPLFHYKTAGNAYCYAYETLAELLRLALERKRGRVLRDRLRPYWKNLVAAWHYARKTALELERQGTIGWCSGHHPHRTAPEAWATASVFSYLQKLRCLLGMWAAEEAKMKLAVKPPDGGARESGMKKLGDRGDTWQRSGSQTVGRQLAMLFLHPLEAVRPVEAGTDSIDPDEPLVEQSRSAVLFGPPGGSKTSIVSGLANALEWDFVEVLASDFLSKGMDSVPEVADSIFKRIMELDHCVILFDEIDELIRLRDDAHSDPFGRFLTTSMLPKLAKLWDQRRVLFFVATNDIEAADPAIKRSQRFDAAIFVPPPSFRKKKARLEELLAAGVPQLTESIVNAALNGEKGADPAYGVFAFLRWDQIDGLANRVEELNNSETALRQALEEMGTAIQRSDWKRSTDRRQAGRSANSQQQAQGSVEFEALFERWNQQVQNERRDHRDRAVLRVEDELVEHLPGDWEAFEGRKGYVVITPAVERSLKVNSEGVLEMKVSTSKAVDERGLLLFKPVS